MICIHCDIEFNPRCAEKARAGGKINECPDCANEVAVKYAGVQSADGKQSQATILRFKSEKDKETYLEFWQTNTGMHRGKVCQIGGHMLDTPAIEFETVVDHIPTNHKGKA